MGWETTFFGGATIESGWRLSSLVFLCDDIQQNAFLLKVKLVKSFKTGLFNTRQWQMMAITHAQSPQWWQMEIYSIYSIADIWLYRGLQYWSYMYKSCTPYMLSVSFICFGYQIGYLHKCQICLVELIIPEIEHCMYISPFLFFFPKRADNESPLLLFFLTTEAHLDKHDKQGKHDGFDVWMNCLSK